MKFFAILMIAAASMQAMAADPKPDPTAEGKDKVPASLAGGGGEESDELTGEQFREKLTTMLDRAERSVKLLRDQIVESQTAPFLPQLYMQLAELLTQKSNTLYYIQMEKMKDSGGATKSDKAFSPVVQAQQEAIAVYKIILKDFPNFERRPQAMFRMALALKAIDEGPQFIRTASDVMKLYPGSEEAMRARLLLGQHFFDAAMFDEAMRMFQPIASVKFPYERNMAKYRVGLIYISKERYRDALTMFEQVALDPELKEQENPYNITLKKRSRNKTDLKREALIDSIRAYTHVFKQDADPVGYYSRISPTENHFQEVVEKLAVRYLNMKKYAEAVKLLRTLSERTADAAKVINIYQEVMMMIPIRDRTGIPVEEVRYLLDKFNIWANYYEIPKPTQALSYNFFEKQVRDLGTTSHQYAKSESDPKRKRAFLKRALDFYLLYLGYFSGSPNTVKMATNVADVYFALGDYLRSGDYYLRVFGGEFGPAKDRKILIENAILCLQKKGKNTFYENIRFRGLLINAIAEYVKYDPSRRNDPNLAFAYLKAEYEQGFFPEVLESCIQFMQRFRNSPKAVDAGELILDYFNTRNEMAGLETWANRMLGLNLPSVAFNSKLANLKKTARSKVLTEKIKSVTQYDEFAQGKSYLEAAMSLDDKGLSSEALKQALARSRSERDIDTFLQAAKVMADKEPDARKKGAILKSMAKELLRTTRYIAALGIYEGMVKDTRLTRGERASALEEAVNASLLLRDWNSLSRYLMDPLSADLSAGLKARLREQIKDIVAAPVEAPAGFAEVLTRLGMNDDTLVVLYKAQLKLDSSLRSRISREIQARCGSQSKQMVCRWVNLSRADAKLDQFQGFASGARKDMPGIESVAQAFAGLSASLQQLEGTGDALFESALSMRSSEAYLSFGRYLGDAASANPDLRQVLQQKAQDSANSAKLYQDRCRTIGARSISLRARPGICNGVPTLKELFQQRLYSTPSSPGADPAGKEYEDIQRALFAGKAGREEVLRLANMYYADGHIHHAAAAAAYGAGTFKDAAPDFKAVLGCSVLGLGLTDEAAYHLKGASSMGGLKEKCVAQLNQMAGAS